MKNHPNQQETAEIMSYYNDFRYVQQKSDIAAIYDRIAKTYDKFYTDPTIFKCPIYPSLYLASTNIPKDVKIVDVGCGSGAAVQALKEQGFTNFVGVDGSKELLKIAEEKKIYKSLHQRWIGKDKLGEELEGQFDILVCTGAFHETHINKDGFKEIMKFIDIKSPYHLMCITMRQSDYETEKWRQFFGELESYGFVNKLQMQKTLRYDQNVEVKEWKESLDGYMLVFEVLKYP